MGDDICTSHALISLAKKCLSSASHRWSWFCMRFLTGDAVLCAVCGILSLTITSQGTGNQVSLLPLSLPILDLIKNSSVTSLQLSRSERLGKLCVPLLLARALKKKKNAQAESNFYAQFTVDFTLLSCKQLLRINICVWVVPLTLFCNKKPYCII